ERNQKIGRLRSIVSMEENEKNELTYVFKVVELTTELLLEDLDDSLSLDHHSTLWNALKWSIDRAKTSSKDKISITNTNSSVASAFSCLMDVLLLLDSEYSLPSDEVPPPFVSTPSIELNRRKATDEGKSTILSYLSVRIGDLLRYKKDIPAAAKWYRFAITVDPSNGEGWNQIGILSAQLGSPLDAVYSYYRALFTRSPSTIASSNILTILDGQLDGADTEDMDDDTLVLHALALIHYLRPLPPSLLSRLSSLLRSPRRLLPFISQFSTSHSSTSTTLLSLFQKAFDNLQKDIEDESSLSSSTVATLHLYSRVLPSSSQSIDNLLESRSLEETDLFQLDHFLCHPSPLLSQ
ncbi:hypothetical protein PFISCL1PPCAC_14676, partial [Pristionchus fissidentatus]